MIKRLEHDHIYNLNYTMLLMALALIFSVGGYFVSSMQLGGVVRALETSRVILPDKSSSKARSEKRTIQTTWGKHLKSGGLPLYVQCRFTTVCNAGLRQKPVPYIGISMLMLGLINGSLAFMVNGLLRRKRDVLDDAKWLVVDKYKHPEVLRFTEGERNGAGEITDPVIVHLGYVIEQRPMPTSNNPGRPISYNYSNMKQIGLTSRMLQEHVLVYGPTGTGKTSRVLMHFLMAFAKRGDAVVVPDFKFPKVSEGFLEALAMFRRMGRPVYPILPYSVGGYHIPLFETVQTPQQGRDLAAIIVPDLEFGVSDSEFWKQTQQIILGSVFRTVGASATPTFAEVIRRMRLSLPEFQSELERSGDTDAITQLTRFMSLKPGEWNSFVTGILNGLEPFDDDRVNRTFTSVPGKNFDPTKFVMEGGLLYFGVPTDKMRTKRGEVLMRVLDTYTTNEFVRLRTLIPETGPQRSIRLMYDEAPSLGRLRNILKSVGTLRTFDICFIFGIQNEDQMELAYGDDVWSAITANLATHVILPTGFKDNAAITLSRYLGEREIKMATESRSSGSGTLSQAAMNAKSGRAVGTQKRALVTPSEIEEWPYFMGILRTKGTLPPALVALVPMYDPKPTFYGLDRHKFFVNNAELYSEYTDIMDQLSEAERHAEVMGYINETITPDDLNEHLPTTLKDLYNEWIRFAILDGTLFRRGNKLYEFRYDTVAASLRQGQAQRVVLAFVQSGWLEPGEGIAASPQDWEWVRVTETGFDNLSHFVQAELKNVRFLTEYIYARKELHIKASDLSGGILEARELLPVLTAQEATKLLLKRQDPNASEEQIDEAARLLMARFTRATVEGLEMVAIPLNFPFEFVIKKVLDQAVRHESTLDDTLPLSEVTPRFTDALMRMDERAQIKAAQEAAAQRPSPAAPEAASSAPVPPPPAEQPPAPAQAAPTAQVAEILPDDGEDDELPLVPPPAVPAVSLEKPEAPAQEAGGQETVQLPSSIEIEKSDSIELGKGGEVQEPPKSKTKLKRAVRGGDMLTRSLTGQHVQPEEPHAAPAQAPEPPEEDMPFPVPPEEREGDDGTITFENEW